MSLSSILAALGLAPKTLEQARAVIEPAKATLDSVNALFTAAGLNLEQMLTAGPDALQAHLASLDNSEELAVALAEVERLNSEATENDQKLAALTAGLSANQEIFASVGLKLDGAAPDAAAFKTAFDAHVAKQTTLALAKTGHPPVVHVDAAAEASLTDAEIAAQYVKLPAGSVRLDFFTKHEAALQRAAAALRK
jgi:hypothetical protein